jgi:hypothetical protein
MQNDDKEMVGVVFDDGYKQHLLDLIKASSKGRLSNITQADATILFHWVNHQDDPAYAFVPRRYRVRKEKK